MLKRMDLIGRRERIRTTDPHHVKLVRHGRQVFELIGKTGQNAAVKIVRFTTKNQIDTKQFTQIIAGLVLALPAHAGVFLDLDIGAYDIKGRDNVAAVGDQVYTLESNVSHENPVGLVRLGYRTKSRQVNQWLDISAHVYYQHTSSITDVHDTGIDYLMGGVRFESK